MGEVRRLKVKVRIIDQLRKLYPGKWTWDQGMREWVGPEFCVHAVSVLDGYDDESCHTQLRRTDNGEPILDLSAILKVAP